MEYEKPTELSDSSAWLTADRSWVAQREQVWRKIHAGLMEPATSTLNAQELKALRDYFLTGRMERLTTWRGQTMPSPTLFHRLWFHPDRRQRSWDHQIRFTTWKDYELSIEDFLSTCEFQRISLGGLESRIYEVLFGGKPVRKFLDLNDYQRGVRTWTSKPIAEFFGLSEHLVNILIFAFLNADANLAFVRAYALPQMSIALREGEERWSVLDRPKGAARFKELFTFITAGTYREKLKRPDESALRERDELASDVRVVFDEAPETARVRALWLEHRGPAKPGARKPAAAGKAPAKTATKRRGRG